MFLSFILLQEFAWIMQESYLLWYDEFAWDYVRITIFVGLWLWYGL